LRKNGILIYAKKVDTPRKRYFANAAALPLSHYPQSFSSNLVLTPQHKPGKHYQQGGTTVMDDSAI